MTFSKTVFFFLLFFIFIEKGIGGVKPGVATPHALIPPGNIRFKSFAVFPHREMRDKQRKRTHTCPNIIFKLKDVCSE